MFDFVGYLALGLNLYSMDKTVNGYKRSVKGNSNGEIIRIYN